MKFLHKVSESKNPRDTSDYPTTVIEDELLVNVLGKPTTYYAFEVVRKNNQITVKAKIPKVRYIDKEEFLDFPKSFFYMEQDYGYYFTTDCVSEAYAFFVFDRLFKRRTGSDSLKQFVLDKHITPGCLVQVQQHGKSKKLKYLILNLEGSSMTCLNIESYTRIGLAPAEVIDLQIIKERSLQFKGPEVTAEELIHSNPIFIRFLSEEDQQKYAIEAIMLDPNAVNFMASPTKEQKLMAERMKLSLLSVEKENKKLQIDFSPNKERVEDSADE